MITTKQRNKIIQGVMNSLLVKNIIAELDPDLTKIREAIVATLDEVGWGIEEEPIPEWKDDFNRGSMVEKVAMAKAIHVPFKKMWPLTYLHLSEMLTVAKRRRLV